MNMSKTKKVMISVFIGLCFALSLHAATSGTLTLSGSQPAILSITVAANAAATSLALGGPAVVDLAVGTVTEVSNRTAGYTVTLGSANAVTGSSTFAFFKSSPSTDTLPYTIKYDGGTAVAFVGGAAAVVTNVTAKTLSSGSVKTVTVSFDGSSANLNEAVYTDILTFTIIAK